MTIATGSPRTPSEGVWIRSYVAHTDGLKDTAPMRAGECRHFCSVEGVARGLKLIGPPEAIAGIGRLKDCST